MTSLTYLTAAELREGLLRRDFSAVEIARAHLDRIERTNPTYNSFITVASESALQDAERADQSLKESGYKSPPLTGLPIAVKDIIVTQGIETTCGSKILKGFVPPYDSTAVRKIRKAGGVILGKTNLDEFAMGSSSENSAFGPVRNPWNTERVPGGSSSGSAVAVASGQAALALGTDTGGSIRQPAALSGVFGLRPTYGRVSRYGAVAYASSLDQIGSFGRTTLDLALMLATIAGADEKDSTSMAAPVDDYVHEIRREIDLHGIRIGVPREYFVTGMEREVEQAVRGIVPLAAKLGAEIVDISLPHTEHALAVYYIIALAEASSNLARYDGVRYGCRSRQGVTLDEMYENTRAEGFGTEVKRRILLGTYVLSAGYYDAYYRKAQEVRTLIIDDFRTAFSNRCDVILAPVSPTTAFALGEKVASPLSMYLADIFTIPVNLAGLPGLAFPVGFDSQSLPIGAQLIGPAFSEALLLRVSHALEREIHFDTRKLAELP